MPTTRRPTPPTPPSLAEQVAGRLAVTLPVGEDAIVLDLSDPAQAAIVRCRALAYSARFLRSKGCEEGAALLDDKIIELGGVPDADRTQVHLTSLSMPRARPEGRTARYRRQTMRRVSVFNPRTPAPKDPGRTPAPLTAFDDE